MPTYFGSSYTEEGEIAQPLVSALKVALCDFSHSGRKVSTRLSVYIIYALTYCSERSI